MFFTQFLFQLITFFVGFKILFPSPGFDRFKMLFSLAFNSYVGVDYHISIEKGKYLGGWGQKMGFTGQLMNVMILHTKTPRVGTSNEKKYLQGGCLFSVGCEKIFYQSYAM